MESNPKFAIDLDDFESRLAQAIENERPAPLSIPSQSSTNATMGIPAPTAKLTSTIRRRSNVDQIVPSMQSGRQALDPVHVGRYVMVILSTVCSSAICLALWKTIDGATNPSPWKVILLSLFASCWIGLVDRWNELTKVCGYDNGKRSGLRITMLVALTAYVGIATLWMDASFFDALSLLGWSGLCRWGYESTFAFTSPADDAGKRAIASSSFALAQQATKAPLLMSLFILAMGSTIAWLHDEWNILALASISFGCQWLYWIACVVIESTNESSENRQALGGGF